MSEPDALPRHPVEPRICLHHRGAAIHARGVRSNAHSYRNSGEELGKRPLLPCHVHDGCDRSPDPFGGSLDFPVAEMGVTQRHADVGVTEHP